MSQTEFLSALMLGLLGSTHCMAMCGGIASALQFGLHRSAKAAQIAVLFNFGRVLSYATIALILGGLLHLFSQSLPIITTVLRLFAAILLIGMGLYIAGWSSAITLIEKLGAPLWRQLQPVTSRLLPVKSAPQALLVGMLWGWIPCGLVYSSLTWAVSTSTSASHSALLMFFFGLGTLPSMLLISLGSAGLNAFFRQPSVRKAGGVLLVLMGLWSLQMPLMHLLDPTTSHSHGSQQPATETLHTHH